MPQGRFTLTIVWEDGENAPIVFERATKETRFVSWNRVQEVAQNIARAGIHQVSLDDFKRRARG